MVRLEFLCVDECFVFSEIESIVFDYERTFVGILIPMKTGPFHCITFLEILR